MPVYGTGFFVGKIRSMNSVVLKNASLVLPGEVIGNVSVKIEDGVIAGISEGDAGAEGIDLLGAIVYPGFIDVHIHGGVGVDTNAADAKELERLAAFLLSNGVTAWVPTLVPDSDANYQRAMGVIDELIRDQKGKAIAQASGVHYEGVFASEKMCGALRPQFFKKFTGPELAAIPKLKSGVHVTTIAPEVEGGIELIKEMVRQDWVVSIGHTNADVEILNRAFDAGARHLTHFFNAMSGLHHRDLGVVGWAFSKGEVTFDIIADGIHVHPEILKFACLNKTVENVSLISDAVLPAGLGDGEFEVWGEKISVENGRTTNARGSIAGSVITMLDAVKRMLSLDFSPVEVSRMASQNPARLLGIDGTHGSIEIGKRADIVALDGSGRVALAMVGGNILR